MSERLCKNKNKEVLKCKRSKTKFKQKEDLGKCKSKQKTIIAPLIRKRKRCRKTRNN